MRREANNVPSCRTGNHFQIHVIHPDLFYTSLFGVLFLISSGKSMKSRGANIHVCCEKWQKLQQSECYCIPSHKKVEFILEQISDSTILFNLLQNVTLASVEIEIYFEFSGSVSRSQ